MASWSYCSHKGCRKRYRNDRWSKIEAHDKGWMMQKNGDNWCPGHLPDWVEEWRKNRK